MRGNKDPEGKRERVISGPKRNCIVAQSGGPTAVINESLCGVIQEAQRHEEIGEIYGARNGISGLLKGELIDLRKEKSSTIDSLRTAPGAALGSCRYRLKSWSESSKDFQKVIDICRRYHLRYFFYIGGNDSMDTANKVDEAAKKMNYQLEVIGIPKTVDNDLVLTDHCPGFGSGAKYLAISVMEAGRHLESLCNSEVVTILETLGRNTGWLAGACALAKQSQEDAPHLIYFPEIPFSLDKFIKDVREAYHKIGWVFIVVSEGLRDEKGNYLCARKDRVSTDAFGHPELEGISNYLKEVIESRLQLKTRTVKPDVCQQSAMHFASKVDKEEAYLVGREAVRTALEGKSGYMITIRREKGRAYKRRTSAVRLSLVANMEKRVPRRWINNKGNFVTREFIEYVSPLIQGEVDIAIQKGLPYYPRLEKRKIVAKR
ncbi:MAG: 6-phosphofructokinase [bacterium]